MTKTNYFISYTLLIVSLCTANPLDEVNNFSGINVDFSGVQGVDYAEEYMYHDPLVTDRRVVYIKGTTNISFSHNDLNTVANGYGSYFHPIGANGMDEVPDSGDEGLVRYKVDHDLHAETRYANTDYDLFPAAYDAINFATLTYPDTTPVLGSTGHSSGDLTDTKAYFKGLEGPHGDEWHTLQFWDDDQAYLQPLDIKEEYWASDGKQLIFVVNPKTPALQIWKSGNAQFYTTPAKTYDIPKIHDQTTYIDERDGVVNLQVVDINGNNVFYRINGGTFIDAGSNSVELTHADFSSGTNSLEYYFAGNAEYTKTREIVRSPGHPSLAEKHGKFLWGHDTNQFEAFLDRAKNKPFEYHYKQLKTNEGANTQSYWLQHGRDGSRRYLFKSRDKVSVRHPNTSTGAFSNAILAVLDGFDSKHWRGSYPTYGEFATEIILGIPWFRVDPIGWEIDHSQGAHPSTEVIGAGYYTVKQILDACMAYDILAGHFRSDQVTGGMTPIEDFFIRDQLAKWVVNCNKESRARPPYTERRGGMWDTAKWSGSVMIAMCMTEYSTSYYGTSGYGNAQTGYEYTPFIGDAATWRETFFVAPEKWTFYPGRGRLYTPEPSSLLTESGTWNDDNIGYFNLMQDTFTTLLNLTEMYDPQSWPILRKAVESANEGNLEYFGGVHRAYFFQLVNERFPTLALTAKNSIKADSISGLSGSNNRNYVWYNPFYDPDSAQNATPTGPSNLRTNQ